ncbi:hypothetical protein H9X96_05860 [Pedobacter sp. N36a]|nr:hypothetical protein [Pedobacter sp. N36a]MBC8985295.1 hypothetical protein [Pedobacter sp. N36a]
MDKNGNYNKKQGGTGDEVLAKNNLFFSYFTGVPEKKEENESQVLTLGNV